MYRELHAAYFDPERSGNNSLLPINMTSIAIMNDSYTKFCFLWKNSKVALYTSWGISRV
jgi:hypothetical protein